MLDWNDLRHFLAVARHGSTIAAAKALGVNQSTVHRRLSELERQLGRRLVERHPSGYRLSRSGRGIVAIGGAHRNSGAGFGAARRIQRR